MSTAMDDLQNMFRERAEANAREIEVAEKAKGGANG